MDQFVIDSLLKLRQNLCKPDFLQQHVFTRDESKFAGSTYQYWIRLHRTDVRLFDQLITDPEDKLRRRLRELEKKICRQLPDVYSSLIKLPSNTKPEDSVRSCLSLREQRINDELPQSIPYAFFFTEICRFLAPHCATSWLSPTESETTALLGHLSRASIKKARSRYPELWDESKGHYVLDSRGTIFAKKFIVELVDRGLLGSRSRFVDLGSGVGTMVAAVRLFSEAHATGIEKHRGALLIARSMIRRLHRKQCLNDASIGWILGDFHESDLSEYDMVYAYSPIGKWEFDFAQIFDRMRNGATLATSSKLPRDIQSIREIAAVAGLPCYQKVAK